MWNKCVPTSNLCTIYTNIDSHNASSLFPAKKDHNEKYISSILTWNKAILKIIMLEIFI